MDKKQFDFTTTTRSGASWEHGQWTRKYVLVPITFFWTMIVINIGGFVFWVLDMVVS